METIEKVKVFSDGETMYRTSCECLDKSHSCDFSVGFDAHNVHLNIVVESCHDSHVWSHPRWNKTIRSYIRRVRSCWKLLTTGCLTYESSFIFRGEDNIDEFCETIQKAKEEMKKNRIEEEKKYEST